MNGKYFCFTIDLEPDFLSEHSHEILLDDERFCQIEDFFVRNRIQPTVFVVANMLANGLPVRERFGPIGADLELHSYSHNLAEPDSEYEICAGKEIFTHYFGRPPIGYRAPNGAISPRGIQVLHREGFLYDASVFPTWRPELGYNFRDMPCTPWIYEEYPRLLEFPFAVVPKVRVVLSLSFLKLLGMHYFRLMFHTFGFPNILVFDSHLYDFFLTSPVRNLSRLDWRRHALMRNQNNVLVLLQQFVDFLSTKGYQFVNMRELHAIVTQSRENIPTVSAGALTYAPSRRVGLPAQQPMESVQ